MCSKKCLNIMGGFLCLLLIILMTGTASAITDVYLRVDTTILNMPDGTNVPAWGYAQDSAFGAGDGTISVPGPVLKVPAGETLLRIHLDNNLPEATSVHINGLLLANNGGPVFTDLGGGAVTTGSRPSGNTTTRVRSFGHETPAYNTSEVIYEFNLRPGTYLYGSGTNPAKQVQMGLYGALSMDTAPGMAYAGVSYTNDLVLVYSEMDPSLNVAIHTGAYGPGAAVPSSIHRDPKYFLINGMAYDASSPNGGGLNTVAFFDNNDTVLVRVLNAGYETHVPQFLNMYVDLVAEDGNPYLYPKKQYGFELPAGKTVDAVLTPSGEGIFSIHDASLHLTNSGEVTPGGMLAYYGVGCTADLNHDGSVNFLDLGILKAKFGTACVPGVACPGDINKDGSVNFLDLGLLKANFGNSGCAAIP